MALLVLSAAQKLVHGGVLLFDYGPQNFILLLNLDLLILLIKNFVFLFLDLSPELSHLLRVVNRLLLSKVLLHFVKFLEASVHSFVVLFGITFPNFFKLLFKLWHLGLLWGFQFSNWGSLSAFCLRCWRIWRILNRFFRAYRFIWFFSGVRDLNLRMDIREMIWFKKVSCSFLWH